MNAMRTISINLMQHIGATSPLVAPKAMTTSATKMIPYTLIQRNLTSLVKPHARNSSLITRSIHTHHSDYRKYYLRLGAAATLGIAMISLNKADCANGYQEEVKDFVLGNTCEYLLQSILGLSSFSAGILAKLLSPQMLGDSESEMFGQAMQREAQQHLNRIRDLPKNTNLSMSQMDVIKSICPFNGELGLLFSGRFVPYSQLYEAIQKAKEIEAGKR